MLRAPRSSAKQKQFFPLFVTRNFCDPQRCRHGWTRLKSFHLSLIHFLQQLLLPLTSIFDFFRPGLCDDLQFNVTWQVQDFVQNGLTRNSGSRYSFHAACVILSRPDLVPTWPELIASQILLRFTTPICLTNFFFLFSYFLRRPPFRWTSTLNFLRTRSWTTTQFLFCLTGVTRSRNIIRTRSIESETRI